MKTNLCAVSMAGLCLVGACESYMAPEPAQFGASTEANIALQTINPDGTEAAGPSATGQAGKGVRSLREGTQPTLNREGAGE